ncbi:uncharacterized protein LOC127750885 [Frankliniella occidentalis]|uniref:Uncharacterized protein LOC127750885 n=1 Tax=Frankliniella occidentalis TaxID=133901 RepID=A0A9C6XSD7_FRAOC|nr:uncharacterized protein LOC127750885 [Frankliniella occidentalis]
MHKRGRAGYNAFPGIKPTRKTLRAVTLPLDLKPGLSPVLLHALTKRVEVMSDSAKDVIIIVDETAAVRWLSYDQPNDEFIGLVDLGNGRKLPWPAEEIMVAMVRGIFGDWKQPLAFWPTCKRLTGVHFRDMFKEVIEAVLTVGLRVRAIGMDGLGKNYTAVELLGASLEDPWFFLGGQKIYVISDVPHLLKCLRNALLKYPLELGH